MTESNKSTIRRITRSVETVGTPTLTALYEFALLRAYKGGQTSDQMVSMLQEIGSQIRKERYDRDVVLAALRKLQRDNDNLRQMDLFSHPVL